MSFTEPTLPSMPVNVTGSGRAGAPLDEVRQASCYKKTRATIRFALGLEKIGLLGVLMYCLTNHRGQSSWLLILGSFAILGVSWMAADAAHAFLDAADVQLQGRVKHDVQPSA